MKAMVERLEQAPADVTETIEARAAARGKIARSRLIAFYALTAITGVSLVALGLSSAAWPWYAPTQPFLGMRVEAHRWHGAQFAALLAILLGGSLLALLWRPKRQPLLGQYLIASGSLIVALFEIFVGPAALIFGLPFALIVALYPNRSGLLDLRMRERWNRPLGVVSGAATALLMQPTYLALSYQILYPHSEHAEHDHWVAAVALAVALALGGLLAATRRPGWRILATLVGIAYTYLGLAAIAVPTHAGSWGTDGGIAAAVAGALYVALALLPGRQLDWYASGAEN